MLGRISKEGGIMLKQVTCAILILILAIIIGNLTMQLYSTCNDIHNACSRVKAITTHLQTISEKLNQLVDADRGLLKIIGID